MLTTFSNIGNDSPNQNCFAYTTMQARACPERGMVWRAIASVARLRGLERNLRFEDERWSPKSGTSLGAKNDT